MALLVFLPTVDPFMDPIPRFPDSSYKASLQGTRFVKSDVIGHNVNFIAYDILWTPLSKSNLHRPRFLNPSAGTPFCQSVTLPPGDSTGIFRSGAVCAGVLGEVAPTRWSRASF